MYCFVEFRHLVLNALWRNAKIRKLLFAKRLIKPTDFRLSFEKPCLSLFISTYILFVIHILWQDLLC